MGALREKGSGRLITLGASTLVGRSAAAGLQVGDGRVSSEHASVSFHGDQWRVRDLGSRNGTRLNGTAVATEVRAIELGAQIQFGHPENSWELVDDSPPNARAEREGETIWADPSGGLYLPSLEASEACVHFEDGRWVADSEQGQRLVSDQQQLEVAGRLWTLSLPPGPAAPVDSTIGTLGAVGGGSQLHFLVSLDEEHVRLRYLHEQQWHDLGVRSSFYPLVQLARSLREDRAEGVPEGDAGWVYCSELCEQLRTTEQHLNVLIFRVRKLFKPFGLAPNEVIARRPGQLRLMLGNFEIEQGSGSQLS